MVTNEKIKSYCIFTVAVISLILAEGQAQQNLPEKWWDKNKARSITSFDEYINLINGDLKDKFVIIDFF